MGTECEGATRYPPGTTIEGEKSESVPPDTTPPEGNDNVDRGDEGAHAASLAETASKLNIVKGGGRPSDPGFTSAAALALEVGSWLVEVGVKAIGIDLPAVDNPGSRSFPVHMALLSAGIPIYENLVNLEEIDEPRFTFFGFPLRVAGASGSAVRAVAIMGASAGTLPSNSGW